MKIKRYTTTWEEYDGSMWDMEFQFCDGDVDVLDLQMVSAHKNATPDIVRASIFDDIKYGDAYDAVNVAIGWAEEIIDD